MVMVWLRFGFVLVMVWFLRGGSGRSEALPQDQSGVGLGVTGRDSSGDMGGVYSRWG